MIQKNTPFRAEMQISHIYTHAQMRKLLGSENFKIMQPCSMLHNIFF